MDSPESSIPATSTTSTACETAPVQDSPVFSYISNLSPIQPVKAPSVTEGFPGLNSPPLVFTSPQLNLHNQSTFLRRAQFPRTSFAKLQEQLEDSKSRITTAEGHGKLDIQTDIVASCQKASNRHVDGLIQSPSGSQKQFLEDIVIESPDPKFKFDSTIKISDLKDQPTDPPTCSRAILVNIQHELSSGINEVVVPPPSVSKQTEEVQAENISIHGSASENDIRQGDGVSFYCPKIGPVWPAENALVNLDENNFTAETAEAELDAPLDLPSHLLTGSKVINNGDEIVVATTGEATLTVPTLKNVKNNLKAFQNRGARRRCLQFEDAQHNVTSNRLAHDSSDAEGAESLSLETPSMLIDGKVYSRNSLISSIKLPKPSGIGLHLNSIINSVQAGSGEIINLKATHWATADGNKHEIHDPAVTLSADIVKPANNLVTLNSKASLPTLGNKRKATENGSGPEGINNLSPKKKRMMNTTDGGDGCKRCNCKRSKCLKLYCDCFAAGIYCAEPCACQECYNRPEYKDTVVEARQKIESRDPFAFTPRVVQHIIEQPKISCREDGANFTPASARHKKGCKCKKSMCLKKYCECYQVNVGCSDGCRCEGCKNVYGQKGEYGMTKIVMSGEDAHETTDDSFVEKSNIDRSLSQIYHHDFVSPHNLTPLTPAFQFSNHGKDASKAWFPSGKFSRSPESGLTYSAPYMMLLGSPRNSENSVAVPESSKDVTDLVSFDQDSHHAYEEFSASCPQSGKNGQFSDIPNLKKWADNSSSQPSLAQRNYLSGSSLVWRGSPITPMAQFSGGNIVKEVEFDFGLSNSMQDDTPEILRDTPNPLNTVKTTSPNKKRVSPPHGKLHEFSSSSSASIRSGRKFILKAVPPFPPLTPCINSKPSGVEQDNFTENHGATK